MRQSFACLLLALMSVLTGCKSPLEKIDQFAAEEDFDGALAYLVEKGVASSVSAELDRNDEEVQKLLAARDLYRGKIEDRFGKEAASALDRGNSRAARRLADAALLRCAWSDELRKLATRAAKAVARLDEGLAAHARLEKADLAAHWAFIERYKPDAKLAADDAAFIEALESVSRKLAAAESAGLRDDLEHGDADAVNSRIEKLRRLYVDESQLSQVVAFTKEILASYVTPRLLEADEVRGFVAKRGKWRGITQPQLSDVVAVLLASVDGWMAKSLRLAVERKHDAKGLVDAVEELYVSRGRRDQAGFSLADLHVIRGARLAKEGANASAALFHFERARDLNPSADVSALIELAKSTRSKLKPMTVSLTLSSGAEAAPDTIGPVYYISALNLIEKTRDGVRWALAEPETPGADVTLFIEKAERFVPKVADLSVVQSRYFAHMQSVPNPQ